jgi:hypothetical protein
VFSQFHDGKGNGEGGCRGSERRWRPRFANGQDADVPPEGRAVAFVYEGDTEIVVEGPALSFEQVVAIAQVL